jgi:hypothetical protein
LPTSRCMTTKAIPLNTATLATLGIDTCRGFILRTTHLRQYSVLPLDVEHANNPLKTILYFTTWCRAREQPLPEEYQRDVWHHLDIKTWCWYDHLPAYIVWSCVKLIKKILFWATMFTRDWSSEPLNPGLLFSIRIHFYLYYWCYKLHFKLLRKYKNICCTLLHCCFTLLSSQTSQTYF